MVDIHQLDRATAVPGRIERPAPRLAGETDSLRNEGARRPPTLVQWLSWGVPAGVLTAAWTAWPAATWSVVHVALGVLFAAASLSRLVFALRARASWPAPDLPTARLPRYTIVAPLYQEAEIAPQLVAALNALDYPRSRLQVLLAVEADDVATREALAAIDLPRFMRVLVAPPGTPRTKPRACNIALEAATGELLTIYDAEDRPHPGQLREAAARFAAGSPRLACLQAPLRIDSDRRFLPRQFALEYAAQFEVLLPALARLGLPFPLGGTSNHFRGIM